MENDNARVTNTKNVEMRNAMKELLILDMQMTMITGNVNMSNAVSGNITRGN